jgi:thymidylate synthase (FAD)
MRVKLIAHTTVVADVPGYIPHTVESTFADRLAEMAGRLCYLAWIRKNPSTLTNKGYLKNILKLGHFSVTEHASATFYIDGVTRAFLLELERHRHMSYSVVSQRYVDAIEFDLVEHPELSDLDEDDKLEIAIHRDRTQLLYRRLVDNLVAKGKNVKTARGAARTVLPEGTETRLLISGNMRAWMELLWKRTSPTADEEIRQVAQLILPELKKLAPNIFQDFPE